MKPVNLAIVVFAAVILLLFADWAFDRQARFSPQQSDMAFVMQDPDGQLNEVRRNLLWATGDSAVPIVKQERGVKPPAYPLVLFAADKLGVADLGWVNRALYVVFVFALGWCAAFLLERRAVAALLVFVLAYLPFHAQFAPFRTEALFLTATLLTLVAMLRYWRNPDWINLACITIALAIACATRFIAVPWLVPVVGLNLLIVHHRNLPIWILRSTVGIGIALVPCGLFMLDQYLATGFLTGIDRSEPRFPFQERTSIAFLVTLDSLTWVMNGDLLNISLTRLVQWPSISPGGGLWYALPVTFLMLMFGLAFVVARNAVQRLQQGFASDAAVAFLAAEFFATYLLATIAIWTFGNNDPLWTRFLVPAYPFLLLTLAAAYSFLTDAGSWQRRAVAAVLAVFIAIHVVGIWRLV